MAAGIPARLTRAQGRKFGLTVGGAFLILAAIASWRGHPISTMVLGSMGAALGVAGLAIPTRLGPVERGWMRLAHLVSRVTTPIVMGVLYLVVLTPIGLIRRGLGGNPLAHAAQDASYWKSRPGGRRAGNLHRQY